MQPISFSGDAQTAICPITHTPLAELELAVAFRELPQVPFECHDIVRWLHKTKINPVTNQEVTWQSSCLELIGPLDRWCRDPQQAAKILREELKGEFLAIDGDVDQRDKALLDIVL